MRSRAKNRRAEGGGGGFWRWFSCSFFDFGGGWFSGTLTHLGRGFVAKSLMRSHELYRSIQFQIDFIGMEFFQTPEMWPVWDLLTSTHAGWTFNPSIRKEMSVRFREFPTLNKTERLLALLDILYRLSASTEIRPVGKSTSQVRLCKCEEKHVSQAFSYLNENLLGPISQAEVAKKVRLSPPAFSRLFKKTTGKCFTQVVTELRISHACRLLAETARSISEIAFESGFESLSSFHFQFRRLMEMSPGRYRQKFETIASGIS